MNQERAKGYFLEALWQALIVVIGVFSAYAYDSNYMTHYPKWLYVFMIIGAYAGFNFLRALFFFVKK